MHAVNIKIGGGLQVAAALVEQAIESRDFDRIYVSPELAAYTGGFADETVEVIGGAFRAIKLFWRLRGEHRRVTVFGVFGPTGVPKIIRRFDSRYILGFATPWLIPTNSWYTKKLPALQKIKNCAKEIIYRHEADALICEADYIVDELSDWGPKLYCAKNGCNPVFKESPIEAGSFGVIPSGKLVGLYVSAGYPHKNHRFLYDFAKLATEKLGANIKVRVTLTEEEFKKIFPMNDSGNYIENLGRLSLKQVPGAYSRADFVIVPTLVEASSAVLYEAIFCEKLIFAFDFIFNREIGEEAIVYLNHNSVAESVDRFLWAISNQECLDDIHENVKKLKDKYLDNSSKRYHRILEIIDRCEKFE